MTRHVDEGHQQDLPRDGVIAPTSRRDGDELDEAGGDGGDPSCWAHLLCPDCGAVTLDGTASCDCVRSVDEDVDANLEAARRRRGNEPQ